MTFFFFSLLFTSDRAFIDLVHLRGLSFKTVFWSSALCVKRSLKKYTHVSNFWLTQLLLNINPTFFPYFLSWYTMKVIYKGEFKSILTSHRFNIENLLKTSYLSPRLETSYNKHVIVGWSIHSWRHNDELRMRSIDFHTLHLPLVNAWIREMFWRIVWNEAVHWVFMNINRMFNWFVR